MGRIGVTGEFSEGDNQMAGNFFWMRIDINSTPWQPHCDFLQAYNPRIRGPNTTLLDGMKNGQGTQLPDQKLR
jgi:hypothetical protein